MESQIKGILAGRLQEQGWLLADGATGTNLFRMGLESGEAPELWNERHPDRVRELYKSSVNAGADIFLTNSFGANRARLKLHAAESRSSELARKSAEIGRELVDDLGSRSLVAGSMGPLGELIEPVGELSFDAAVEMFHEQAEGLKAGGADLLWVETISSKEEFLAAAKGCALAEMPWCGTMSFDTAGRTMMGVAPNQLPEIAKEAGVGLLATGANCGAGISDLVLTILAIADCSHDVPIIAKGNAGIPKYVDGHIHYDGTPQLMARYAEFVRNAGASIIGGCCGTTADHLKMMRERLESAPKGDQPNVDEVASVLGPISFDRNKVRPQARGRRRRR